MSSLLFVYCILILLASLAGGWIPLLFRLTHTRMQLATSFVAGLMLGVGVLHMLPHAMHHYDSIDGIAGWVLAGFLAMFFIQRFFHFHHHDVPSDIRHRESEAETHCGHSHEPAPDPREPSLAERSASKLTWTGAALGLTFHTLTDGMALAASVRAESGLSGSGWLLGFSTFLVIILHKPFDAMAIGALMAAGGWSRTARHWVNGLFALAIPAGVILFQIGVTWLIGENRHFLGAALAFAAGTFICISTSDLLPELQFHSHDRVKLSISLISGVLLSIALGWIEGAEHGAHPVPDPAAMNMPATGVERGPAVLGPEVGMMECLKPSGDPWSKGKREYQNWRNVT